MEKSILVVGATGLLGEPVARRLNRDGCGVRLMVRGPALKEAENRFGGHFEIVTGDAGNAASLERALTGCFGVHINLMENLPKYVRGNRAVVFGKQPNPYHLLAAEDYAGMVAASYGLAQAVNKRFIIHGPEGILFHEAVRQYCAVMHPGIKSVSTMPYRLATLVASLTGRRQLKLASDFMAAFERIGEKGDPSEANRILGAPATRLQDWLRQKKRQKKGEK